MDTTIQYSVVIPVYRGAQTLELLTRRLVAVLDSLQKPYEILFIDDGSPDNSWDIIKKTKNSYPHIRAMRLMRNFGQHNALMCGFNHARGAYIITMDDDLQHPPEEIPKLIDAISDRYDIVYGVYAGKKHNFLRNLGSRFIIWSYHKALGVRGDITSFRIIRREIIQNVIAYDKSFTFIDGFLAWHTRNIGYVKIQHDERATGRSGYSLGKMLNLSFNLFTNFSLKPLQLASVVGIIFALIGFLLGIYYLGRRILVGTDFPGFSAIFVAVSIFSGIQLIILGLIGEYLGRIHMNISKKPQYAVREDLGDNAD